MTRLPVSLRRRCLLPGLRETPRVVDGLVRGTRLTETPREFVERIRIDAACRLFEEAQLAVQVVAARCGFEIAAEGCLRIGDEGWPVEMAVIFDQERPVVGDQLGKQRNEE